MQAPFRACATMPVWPRASPRRCCKWGGLAAEQLVKMLAGESVESERVYVRLVEGDSARLG